MRMMLWLCLLLACGAQPAPDFFGAAQEEIARGENRYVLFRRENRFEIIRLGPYLPRGPPQAEQIAQMLSLVEARSGCNVRAHGTMGDAGEIRGSLRCPRTK